MQVVMVQRDVLPEHREACITAARAYGRARRQHARVVRFALVQDAADEASRDAQLRSHALREYRDSCLPRRCAPDHSLV